jgi:hypothetical protein
MGHADKLKRDSPMTGDGKGALIVVAIQAITMVGLTLVPAIVASDAGKRRGSIGSGPGFLLGLFFSWLGFLIVISFPIDGRAICPWCRSRISQKASVCPKCTRDVAVPIPKNAVRKATVTSAWGEFDPDRPLVSPVNRVAQERKR